MSSLLLDEEPLLIMPQLAVKVGLNEAIILQQIHYWLKHNKRQGKNYIDDRYWTYNTYEDWRTQFPFWSVSTIKRAIYNLEKLNLIISSSEYNKLFIDKTKWYTINYENLDKISTEPTCQNETSQNDTKDVSKRNDQRVKKKRPSVQNERTIPETTTKTKKETIKKTKPYGGKVSNFNNYQQRDYDDSFYSEIEEASRNSLYQEG